MDIELPEHEVVVSSFSVADGNIIVRFVTDYHPEAMPNAYEVFVMGPNDAPAAIAFLERCRDEEESVYIWVQDSCLMIETNGGEKIEVSAQAVSTKEVSFNSDELVMTLNQVWEWYLSELNSNREARNRINVARTILTEAVCRVETKAVSHSAESTAGTLYSQQLTLIRRVLDALGN